MWLTEKQVEKLTRRKRPSAQKRVLARAGIPFTEVDGRPIVQNFGVVSSQPRPQVRHLPREKR